MAAEAGAVADGVARGAETGAGLDATGVERGIDVDKFGVGVGQGAQDGEVFAVQDAVREGGIFELHALTDRTLGTMSLYRTMRAGVYRFGGRFFSQSMAANSVNFAMLSHPGRVRKGNEDTCAGDVPTGAFVVCDGMGGAAAGEVASRVAADTFMKALRPVKEGTPRRPTPDFRLDAAIYAANKAVFDQSQRSSELRGMGTTLVALLLEPASTPGLPIDDAGACGGIAGAICFADGKLQSR